MAVSASQRLEAEIVRDSILAARGALDLTMGGPPVFPHVAGGAPDVDRATASGRTQTDGPDVWRRSVYIYRKRGCRSRCSRSSTCRIRTCTCGARNVSTVPTQALTLLNNEFVLRQAQLFADRVRKEAGDDAASRSISPIGSR